MTAEWGVVYRHRDGREFVGVRPSQRAAALSLQVHAGRGYDPQAVGVVRRVVGEWLPAGSDEATA